MRKQPYDHILPILQPFVNFASKVVTGVGFFVLLGWVFDIALLKSIIPNAATMKFNTALCFLLTGASLWFLQEQASLPKKKRIGKILAGVVVISAALTLSQYLFKWDLGIDQLFMRDPATAPGAFPGRMSHITAICFVLGGIALLLIDTGISQYFSISVIILSLLAVIGYIFDYQILYTLIGYSSIALHTALAFFTLSLAILLSRPSYGLMKALTPELRGTRMTGLLLPITIVLIIMLGWLAEAGQNLGFLNADTESVILTIAVIFVLSPVIFFFINHINQAEEKLHETQELFRSLFDLSPVAYSLARLSDHKIVEANPACENLFEYTKDEVVGTRTTDLDFWVDPNELQNATEKFRRDGSLHDFEFAYKTKSGTIGWALTYANLIEQAGEKYVLSAFVNITERKQAERQVLQMKRLYATLSQVNQTIVRVTSHAELYQSICDVAVQSGEFSAAWIGLLDEASGDVQPTAASGLDIANWPFPIINIASGPLNNGLIAASIRTSKVMTSDDIQSDEKTKNLYDLFQKYAFHSSASIPFRLRGKTIGIVSLVSPETGLFNAVEEVKLLEEMGLDISFALEMMETEVERKQAEETIRESQELFLKAFRSNPGAMVISRLADGLLMDFNSSYEQLFEYTREELIGKTSASVNIIDPEARNVIMEKLRADGHVHGYETTFRTKSGKLINTIFSIEKIELAGEQCMLTIIYDITDRKQAEVALKVENERFQRFVESNIVGIVIANAAGKIITANDYYLNILGVTRRELEDGAVDWRKFTPPEWLAADEKALRELSERGVCEPYEKEYVRADGRRIPVYLTNAMLPGPEQQIAAFVLDISDLKQAEEALRESGRRIDAIIASAMDAIISIDADQHILMLNAAAEQMFQCRAAEAIGQPLERFIPQRFHVSHRKHIEQFGRDGTTNRAMGRLTALSGLRSDGEEFPIEASISQVTVRDEKIFTVILRDITGRKRAENAIKAQLERLTALRDIDRAITSTTDLSINLGILLSRCISLLDIHAADVMLLNPVLNVLDCAASLGFQTTKINNAQVRLGEGLAGRAALTQNVIHVHDLTREALHPLYKPLVQEEGFVEYAAVPLISKGKLLGILEAYYRRASAPESDWLDFLETLASQAAIAIDVAQSFTGLQKSNLELMMAYDATIAGWSQAMDLRDKETEGHTQRVTEMTIKLARVMGIRDADLIHIRRGALLHDIGKLGVPDSILLKPSKLTDEEWVIMKRHTEYAFRMLSPIVYLRPAIDIPYCHHEKWDGTGYPRGLKGEQIPLAACIFAVVDVWDALTSDRPYRPAWTKEQTLEYIKIQSGSHFDPQIVDAFLGFIS